MLSHTVITEEESKGGEEIEVEEGNRGKSKLENADLASLILASSFVHSTSHACTRVLRFFSLQGFDMHSKSRTRNSIGTTSTELRSRQVKSASLLCTLIDIGRAVINEAFGQHTSAVAGVCLLK